MMAASFSPHAPYHRVDASGELTINRPWRSGPDHDAASRPHRGHVIFMDLPIVFNLEIRRERQGRHTVPAGMTT